MYTVAVVLLVYCVLLQHPIFDALDCRDDELKFNGDKEIPPAEDDIADFANNSFGDDGDGNIL